MNLQELQDELRARIRDRIRRGELTGVGLARRAGFPQGHLSTFLTSRRGLSLQSMDRLLDSLGIDLLDLVRVEDLRRRLVPPKPEENVEKVALVAADDVALARFAPHQILETRSFNKAFLRRLKPNDGGARRDWLRFVMIKLDLRSARQLLICESSRATLLIDRRYNSLQPYRQLQPNLYAVTFPRRCAIGYVSLVGNALVLRPRDPHQPMEMLRLERGRSYSDYIMGRICHVGLEF